MINSVVTELKDKYDFEIEVIRKPDVSLIKRLSMPKFPAVEIDNEIVAEDRVITKEELAEEIIQRRQAGEGGAG